MPHFIAALAAAGIRRDLIRESLTAPAERHDLLHAEHSFRIMENAELAPRQSPVSREPRVLERIWILRNRIYLTSSDQQSFSVRPKQGDHGEAESNKIAVPPW